MNSPSLKLTVSLPHQLTVFGLVIGGHFPLSLISGRIILLDRNIVSLLRTLARSERSDAEAHRYWLAYLDNPSIKINVGLCALEGRFGRPTSHAEFFEEHDAVGSALRTLLPRAEVLSYAPEIRRNVYDVQLELQDRYLAECAFLMETSGLITERHSDVHLPEVERQVLDAASRLNLKVRSLVVLACLACLYEDKDGATSSSARQVLKPKQSYGAAQAHNAVSDLRSLELLASTSATGQGPVALCTADRGLDAFWCQLGVRIPEWTTGQSFRFDFSLDPRLFARLPEADWARLMEGVN